MRKIIIFFFITVLCNPSFAETIKLKSGMILEGKIIEQTNKYIKIDSGVGVPVTYYVDDISTVDGKELQTPALKETVTLNKSHEQLKSIGANYDQDFDKAKELFGAGDVEGAVANFEKAIKDRPDIIDPYLDIGICYLQTNQYPKAIEAFNRVKTIFPNDWQAYYRLAFLYGEPGNGEIAKALQNYNRAKELGIKENDEIGKLLADFQPKIFSVEYEPFFNNPENKKVTIGIKGNPAVDNSLILDTIRGLEKVAYIKQIGIPTDIDVDLVKLEDNQTIAKEKWTLRTPQGQKEYWVTYNLAPPAGFPYKTKIDISEKE